MPHAQVSDSVLTVRFANPAVYKRLKERATSEHRSMNRLAEEAIEAFVDSNRSPLVPMDETKLRALIRKVVREDADILKALGNS